MRPPGHTKDLAEYARAPGQPARETSRQAGEKPVPARQIIICVIEGNHHSGGAAHDTITRDAAVESRVVAVIAVVAHHEILAIRNSNGAEVARRAERGCG